MAQSGLPGTSRGNKSGFLSLRAAAGAIDLVVAVVLVAAAAVAYAVLPAGSALRLILTLPVLFFAPGFLLIEAVAGPAANRSSQAVRALVAIGVSPPLVGLLALATALLPGGFRPTPIVATLSIACAAFAGVALLRRRRAPVADAVVESSASA